MKAPIPPIFDEAHFQLYLDFGLHLISAILILIAGHMIGRWAERRIRRMGHIDATLATFLGTFARYISLIVAIIAVLGQFGIQTASFLAVLGAAGLAIGLALQGTLSNVAAGTMLLILRPFNVGDFITVGNGTISGTVKSLGLFGTELSTSDNMYMFIPNGQIWNNSISNASRNYDRRQDVQVGISYDDDIGKAFDVIQKTLAADPRVIKTPADRKPSVMVSALGASSVDLIIRFWTTTPDYWAARWDVTKNIKEALDANNISIPYPMRTVQMVHMNPDGTPVAGNTAETE